MTQLFLTIPDDLVDALTLRRMSSSANSVWIATATHRFGSITDDFGQILGPVEPVGVGSALTPEAAWAMALEKLSLECVKRVEAQNARGNLTGNYVAPRSEIGN